PPRDHPTLLHAPVLVPDAELTLALVQIQPYRIHGGWPPGLCLVRNRSPTMSTLICVGRTWPPRCRGGQPASYQLECIEDADCTENCTETARSGPAWRTEDQGPRSKYQLLWGCGARDSMRRGRKKRLLWGRGAPDSM